MNRITAGFYICGLIFFMRLLFVVLAFASVSSFSQAKKAAPLAPAAPKLVVGIVVDQMRWDYLYRYQNRFGGGGFKRLMNEGFNCQNTFVPYVPTVTAAGHTCVYTGSVPNIHGIVGNNWFEASQSKLVYCTDDDSVQSVGSTSTAGKMSPRNLFANTMTDELRLATNFRSKVVGIALKDRGAILPAGHSANAAYWYDDANEAFITSSYYMNDLPNWVKTFNNRKLPDSLIAQGWNTLYPANTYLQSTPDEEPYEGKYRTPAQNHFPYAFGSGSGAAYWSTVRSMPAGNTLTSLFAEAAIVGEGMGKDEITDFLAVSFSTPDYIGHQFGPNSIENEDDYLRFDKELELFLSFLDKQVGKGQYTVFLTADHAVAHVPGFLQEHHLYNDFNFNTNAVIRGMNAQLKTAFGYDTLVRSIINSQVHLNHPLIARRQLNEDSIKQMIVRYLRVQPAVATVFDLQQTATQPIAEKLKTVISNGYYFGRSGDVQIVFKPTILEGEHSSGTTHGSWNPYDSHIPFLLMGWGIRHGQTYRETYMTDIAATVSAMLHIQMPNGCIGKVVEEALQQ
jgi:predicted AlkP superfamily pyrophosphatase or phosphodiesterase